MNVRGFRIVAAAAISPIGADLAETQTSLRLSVQRHRDTTVVGAAGTRVRAGCVFPVAQHLGGSARHVALLESPLASLKHHLVGTAHLVVCGSAWPELDTRLARISSFASEYEAFRAIPSSLMADMAARLECAGMRLASTTLALGGNTAVLEALGRSELEGKIVVVASASLVDPFGLQLLSTAMANGQLPDTFVPGEVGVVLVLEDTHPGEADLLVGPVSRRDAQDALADAVNEVMDELPCPPGTVSEIWTDANGERWRAKALAFAALRAWGRLGMTPEHIDPARCVGETGAAAGALQLALAWQSISPGGAALVTTQNRDGAAIAALVRGAPS